MCTDYELLTATVRNQWGFDGYVSRSQFPQKILSKFYLLVLSRALLQRHVHSEVQQTSQ